MSAIPENPIALYLSHGGGPLPVLGDPDHREMVEQLAALAAKIRRPAAIALISAHWEAAPVRITQAARPPVIYDYYGFPAAAYELQYPASGAPELAQQIYEGLSKEGIRAELDAERGFDHGLYVPLLLMYPQADIPCLQLSLHASLDAAEHIRIGAALRHLHKDNILVIGSGFSFHNLRAFFKPPTLESRAMNEAFDSWLFQTCSSAEFSEAQRTERLVSWEAAPHARYCHPREEHLLPLHVCYGVAGRACSARVELSIMRRLASFYVW